MKPLLPILFLLSFAARATTFPLGSGSGSLTLTSMTGHSFGDTALVNVTGSYSSGNIQNLNGIVILPSTWASGGSIVFTGGMTFANNKYTELGFTIWTSVSGDCLNMSGSSTYNTHIYLHDFSVLNCTGSYINTTGNKMHAHGDTTGYKVYIIHITRGLIFQSNQLWMGSFADASQNHPNLADASDSAEIDNIQDIATAATSEEGTGIRGIFFRFNVHDIRVTSITQRGPTGDVGWVYIKGGQAWVHEFYKSGGPGYVLRITPETEVGKERPVEAWNIISVNGTEYGVINTQEDSTFSQSGAFHGTSTKTYNITGGNRIDQIGYWSPDETVGTVLPGSTVSIRNCIGFNLQTNGKTKIGVDMSSAPYAWNNDTANNYYANSATALKLDTTTILFTNSLGNFPTYAPTASSPSILHTGVTSILSSTDYSGAPYRVPPDLGYLQLPGALPPPPSVNYAPNSKYSIKLP